VTRLQPERAPEWLRPILDGIRDVDAATLSRHGIPPPADGRRSAVLILFGHDPEHGPDVLLTERASTLRSHAGQVSFPGGRTDPDDRDAVATALREAEEETGLVPAGVVPLAVLPDLFIPPTGYVVAPVIAHWADPTAVHAGRSERDGHRRPGSGEGPGRPARPVPGAPSVRLRRAGVLRGRAGRLGFHGGPAVGVAAPGRLGTTLGRNEGAGSGRGMGRGASRGSGGRGVVNV
jgi:8-oxo-dGTP pyrophosphatase MutT (NUDIX family)